MDLKKLYDNLLQKAQARDEIARTITALYDQDKIAEGDALAPKLDEARKNWEAANATYLNAAGAVAVLDGNGNRQFVPVKDPDPGEPKDVKDLRASSLYRNRFIDALRLGATPKNVKAGQFSGEHFAPLMNALSETGGTPAGSEGGFLLPVDFDNLIIERMRQFFDLSTLVNVENVMAYSGWRVIEHGKATEPFAKLTELTKMSSEAESPTFDKIDFTVDDYGGFLQMAQDLLADTPAAIMAYLARWFGRKAVLTKNSLLVPLIAALTPIDVADPTNDLLYYLKHTLNVTLDPDISATATILCNQNSYDLMDQLVDDVGRPMLQPDPTNATQMRFKGRPVISLSTSLLEDLDDGGAPIAIGNGGEFATLFQRLPFEMASTTVGGDAWRANTTEVKGIMRLDVQEVDDEAVALLSVASAEGS